jgi:hypothetical protein
MANTATGKLSTLKDNVQKSLAELVGITNTGEVKDGSLFDRFTKGMGDLTSKIQQASENGNLEKLANGLYSVGNGISSAFGYLMEHPEIGSTLLKVSVGMWALGKVASVVSTFTTIMGAFSEGGILAGVGSALAPIAPYALAIAGAFMLLESALSPDGLLNKGIGWLLSKIPVFGDELKKGWEEDTNYITEFFREAKEGWKMLLGIGSPDDDQKYKKELDNMPWYGGPDGKTPIKDNTNYKTASDMVRDGSITKNSSSAYNNKTEVNVNIAKVEKNADIDEIGDEIAKRLDKRAQTRNNLDD